MKLEVIIICLIASSAFAMENLQYDKHVFFDNSLTNNSYYYSQGSYSTSDHLELVQGKIPVENTKFFYPPNCLRLSWLSKTGGDWKLALHVGRWRGRDLFFQGHTLSFWCYSEQEIHADQLPKIYLKDINGSSTPPVTLGELINKVPILEWFQLKIPLKMFDISTRSVDLHRIKTIYFTQGIDDGINHTLFIDEIKIYNDLSSDVSYPAAPFGLHAKPYDSHIDLQWQLKHQNDILRFVIYRSFDGKNYKPIGIQKGHLNRYSDFIGATEKTAYYKISAVDMNDNESKLSESVHATTVKMSDDDLLTMVQEACFRYYWEGAHPVAGMALENIPGDENLVATGASGFGIMALLVGAERGFITREECVARMVKILKFLKKADRFHGAWPHFLDGKTGKMIPLFGKHDNGGDLVETAFLIQGLLAARQYFNQNNEIERKIFSDITNLWETVEWDWYRREPDSDFLYWHWSPDFSWHIDHPLVGWNETIIVYLLAIASPSHGVPASMYHSGWAGQSEKAVHYRRNWGKTTQGDHYINGNIYYDIKLDVGVGSGGPLFFTHYSFMGFDPRGKKDRYTNYFKNNRNIALINHTYCIENSGNYKDYGENCWGLTASDNPWGYKAHEPVPRNDNGTITPTGALASFPYTPVASKQALHFFYRELGDKIWGIYGFRDAFNLSENWVANIYMGLNQAPITVMIENYRSGLIWDLFMSNPEIQSMLNAIGFVPDL